VCLFFFFQAEDGIRDFHVTGVQTCALPIWGITVATAWQAQVARAAGVTRILLANEVVDPVGAAWIARELDAHPQIELACWVDSRSEERRVGKGGTSRVSAAPSRKTGDLAAR